MVECKIIKKVERIAAGRPRREMDGEGKTIVRFDNKIELTITIDNYEEGSELKLGLANIKQ